MDESVSVRRIRLPLTDHAPLRDEAGRSGFGFVERLVVDGHQGVNRFDGPGACLLGAFAGETLVGIGGLNRDPYAADSGTGRLRHLYVLEAWRGRGVGSALVDRLLAAAQGRFTRVRLRTEQAADFYVGHGFGPSAEADATHVRTV